MDVGARGVAVATVTAGDQIAIENKTLLAVRIKYSASRAEVHSCVAAHEK